MCTGVMSSLMNTSKFGTLLRTDRTLRCTTLSEEDAPSLGGPSLSMDGVEDDFLESVSLNEDSTFISLLSLL